MAELRLVIQSQVVCQDAFLFPSVLTALLQSQTPSKWIAFPLQMWSHAFLIEVGEGNPLQWALHVFCGCYLILSCCWHSQPLSFYISLRVFCKIFCLGLFIYYLFYFAS